MSEQEGSSGSDSESDEQVITLLHTQQAIMISMLKEVDASLEDLRHIRADIHHSQDLFTHLHLQETLQPLLQRWACAKRISDDGLTITLSEEEQKEFGFACKQVTIYELCALLVEKKVIKGSLPKIESHLSDK